MLQQLKDRYEAYVTEVREVKRKAPLTGGLFGMGEDPRDHPCHMQFYEDAEKWMAQFRASNPTSDEKYQAAEWILTAAAKHRGQDVFWFMFAAQGLCLELIRELEPGQCAALRAFYDDHYPRRERMPVQKEVYKRLKKGAAGK